MLEDAGAVMLHTNAVVLKEWVLSSLEGLEPESHGDRWSHRFVLKEIRTDLSICFYTVDGYDTPSENVAFEHAFFVLDDFLGELEEEAPKGTFLAFADVGNDIGTDFIAKKTVASTLKKLDISLDEIRKIRSTINENGTVIWGTGPKMKP